MEKLKIKIASLRNVATNFEVLNSENISNIQVTENHELSIELNVGAIRAASGLIVAIDGEISIGANRRKFNFTGKLVESTTTEKNRCCLRIELLQFDRDLWAQFIKGTEGNQTRADQIFKSIKGDE